MHSMYCILLWYWYCICNLSIKFNDRIEKIIKANPDYLKVSLSGFYPKAYNSTHTGGDINLVKNNLVLIRKLIDEYKADTLIDINYHLYKDNSGENLKQMENYPLLFFLKKSWGEGYQLEFLKLPQE